VSSRSSATISAQHCDCRSQCSGKCCGRSRSASFSRRWLRPSSPSRRLTPARPRTPKSIALATAFGAASSSCSYAAVAVARTLFRKGSTLGNAVIFEFASTNLVFELGLVLLILLGWQFLAAEFGGGLVMIVILAVIFRFTLRRSIVEQARKQTDRGLLGKMEGHGAMDMSVSGGSFFRRLFSGGRLPRSATTSS